MSNSTPEDVFGEAFKAYLKSKECEDFRVIIDGELQDPLPVSYFFRPAEEMPSLELFALDLVEGKVLDVGAAAGCHSLLLQEHFDTTALEISEKACEVMESRGVKKIVCSDFFDYSNEQFDTILFLMNGLGIGKDAEGTIALLKHAKSLLTPGGFILGDSSDISYFKNEDEKKGGDASFSQEYFGIVQFELQWEKLTTSFPWIYPDPSFLEQCATEAGLRMSIIAEGAHYDFLLRFDHL